MMFLNQKLHAIYIQKQLKCSSNRSIVNDQAVDEFVHERLGISQISENPSQAL